MIFVSLLILPGARRRLAGAERDSQVSSRFSRFSQGAPNPLCGRVRATEDAPRYPIRLLERRYGLAEIFERGAVALHLRPHAKRRRSFAQRRRYFCLAYGFGLAFLVGGVLDVIFRIGPYRGKAKWRRRGYRRATHTPTPAPSVSDTT